MTDQTLKIDMKWYRAQVGDYKLLQEKIYTPYATTVQHILSQAVKTICPTAIVQLRAKTVSSFAEKIIRKLESYQGRNAVAEMTDLCGVRVVVHLESEVAEVSRFIESHFHVDQANSQDLAVRLQADQFGYRSVHFIVSPKANVFPNDQIKANIPRNLFGHKAEIQVRTIAQHAWSDIGHDRLYKSAFTVPDTFKREAARIAALLESADDAFAHMVRGVEVLRSNVDAYMSQAQANDELERTKAVRLYAKNDTKLIAQQARLLILLARWDETISLLKKFPIKTIQLCTPV